MQASRLSLARVPIGVPCTIRSIGAAARAELAREGLYNGAVVTVIARTPLGGPVVVQRGRTRLALSADVADDVETAPCGPDGELQ